MQRGTEMAEAFRSSRVETEAPAPALESRLAWQFLKRLVGHRLALMGSLIFLLAVATALLAPWITPYDPFRMAPAERLQPPSPQHLMGTDLFGRDVFARVVAGSRISLGVGFLVVLITSVAGILVGLIAGYFRRLDNVLMRIVDGMMAFPDILLAIALMGLLGRRFSNVVIALAIVYTPRVARIVRSQVLVVREQPYVEAARALGLPGWRIAVQHVLPNCLAPVLVQTAWTFSRAVLSEAALSFVGAGMHPDIPSWGNILSEGRAHMQIAPWVTFFPGLAIMLLVIGLNTLGDGMRDILDPRTSRVRQ